jgi:hypothetical protein
MKLIPPRPAQDVELAGTATVVSGKKPKAPVVAEQTTTEDSSFKLRALEQLNEAGQEFADALEAAIRRVTRGDIVNQGLALMAFLTGGTTMLNTIGTGGTDGHKGSNRTAGRSSGSTRGRKPRATASGAVDSAKPVNAGADSQSEAVPVKRGRGRPKGSTNKSKPVVAAPVVKRAAKAKPAAKRVAVKGQSAAAKKSRGLRVAKANTRKGGAKGGRKSAAKKVGRKR